ncbi:MAG: SOS response-associated peptidase [Nannocystaceae bacterium]
MCGRFTLTRTSLREVAEALEADFSADDAAAYRPRFNVAPTDRAWLLVGDQGPGRRAVVGARWGFPQEYGPRQDDPVGLINARAETAADKPTFRRAFLHGRCAVITDGFYEWGGARGHRQPLWFHTPRRELLLLGGLWREHTDDDTGEVQRRFTVLTTEANAVVSPAHARMPVILPPAAVSRWLTPAPSRRPDQERLVHELRGLLRPADNALLLATPVSSRVNNAKHDDPSLIEGERLLF